MIKELNELVSLTQLGVPHAEVILRLLAGSHPEVWQLFKTIQTHSFRTDQEAMDAARIGEKTAFKKYGKLLRRYLLEMTLLYGSERGQGEDISNARLHGFRLTAMAKLLMHRSSKHAARFAAEQLLELGRSYERPEFVVEAVKILMDFVLSAANKPAEFDSYVRLYEEYSEWRNLEEKAFVYCCRLRLPYIRKKALQTDNVALATAYWEELQPFAGKIPSASFHLYFYSINSNRFTMEANYSEASRVHDEAILYFQTRPYYCPAEISIFCYREIANCFYLGQYERGEYFFQQALPLSDEGSINWFAMLELAFYLYMHQEKYDRAADIFTQALTHRRFSLLRELQQENWRILGAYLYIITQLTGIVISAEQFSKIKSTRFLNEVPQYTQDKTGMNIAILVAHVLLQMLEGRDVEIWDRIAALEKYRERYLRDNDNTARSDCFIKILTILPKAGLNRHKFLRKAQSYLDQIYQLPLQLTNQAHELEIVPYERLVELIINQLPHIRTSNKKRAALEIPS